MFHKKLNIHAILLVVFYYYILTRISNIAQNILTVSFIMNFIFKPCCVTMTFSVKRFQWSPIQLVRGNTRFYVHPTIKFGFILTSQIKETSKQKYKKYDYYNIYDTNEFYMDEVARTANNYKNVLKRDFSALKVDIL